MHIKEIINLFRVNRIHVAGKYVAMPTHSSVLPNEKAPSLNKTFLKMRGILPSVKKSLKDEFLKESQSNLTK